jgi:hypothetical protein
MAKQTFNKLIRPEEDPTSPITDRDLIPFPLEPYVRQHGMQRVEQGWEKFWVLGRIEYTDDAGNSRQTVFCRHWSNVDAQFLPLAIPTTSVPIETAKCEQRTQSVFPI